MVVSQVLPKQERPMRRTLARRTGRTERWRPAIPIEDVQLYRLKTSTAIPSDGVHRFRGMASTKTWLWKSVHWE